MNFLIFFISLWIQDSLENRLLSQYIRDSSNIFFEEFYVKYKGANEFIHEIEIKNIEEIKEEREEKIEKDVVYKSIRDSVFKKKLEETGGLIPEIDIPIPIPKVLGIGEGASIKISGSQDISFGITKDLYRNPAITETSNLPHPEMNQKLRVNALGTIGNKIKVNLDHDSEREAQYKNTVKLQYQGDEDEIIKLIEAGNTQFNLGSSQGAGGKGLFGIRGVFQLGPTSFEGILSREQGQAKKITKSPTFTKEDTLSDYEFVRGVFFKIPVPQNEEIETLWVFYDDADNYNLVGKKRACLFLNPQNQHSFIDTLSYFKMLNYETDWYYVSGYKNIIGLKDIVIEGNKQLAVAYITKTGFKVGSFSGDTTKPDTLLLIRKRGIRNKNDPTWWNELRNVYYIGSNVQYIEIYRVTTGRLLPYDENGKRIVKILNLDYDNDGQIDPLLPNNFRPIQIPYLIFPQEFPFMFDSLTLKDTTIYYYSQEDYDQHPDYGKYKIIFKAQRREEKIQLDYGILPGSEEIYFGDEKWTQGKDYQLDYETGELLILNPAYYRELTKELRINYEIGQIFQLKQRSLIGFKSTYEMGKNLSLENIFVTRMESSIDRRPRLGEEPVRMGQYTMNLKTQANPYFLTKLCDALPIVKTEKESNVRFNLVYNQSFPNPNIYGSALLDDMEGVEESFEFPSSYLYWQRGSPPPGKLIKNLCKKIIWTTRNNLFKKGDINPNLPKEERDDLIDVMQIIYRPLENQPDEWASLHTLISPTGFNFSKYEYVEIIVKGDEGILGIDLANSMSEHTFWRDKYGNLKGDSLKRDTEDKNNNGQLDPDEDTGLDGIKGKDSESKPGDDGNDDYDLDNIEKINGTENNTKLDEEDLDRDGRIDEPDNLFEYVIDLKNDTTYYYKSPAGFKIYRIYLNDTLRCKRIGNPDLSRIKFGRIWISNLTSEDTIYIASIKIVGNRYIKDGIFMAGPKKIPVDTLNEKFYVTTYNNKEHSFYEPPPMKFYKDPMTGAIEREASLVLKFENLKNTHFAKATRVSYRSENIINSYNKIKLWVRVDKLNLSSLKYFIVRFYSGVDTLNYYEYREALPKGLWVNIEIDPLKFINTKSKRPADKINFLYQNPDYPSYFVKGNPNLQAVSKYSFGILNLSGEEITGEVWIDEFRVSEPFKESRYRVETSLNGNFADLLNYSLRYENFQAGFRDLNYSPGSFSALSTHYLYDISTTLYLNKFIPAEGFNIPLSIGYKRTYELPKYMPASDIILTPGESRLNKTDRLEKSFAIDFSKSGSKNKILQYTIDKISLNLRKMENYKKDPLTLDTLRNFSSRASYSLPIIFSGFKFLGQEINPFPTNLNTSLDYSSSIQRVYTFRDSSYMKDRSMKNLILNPSEGISFRPLRSTDLSFSSSQKYDLRRESVRGRWWGEMGSFSQNFSLNYRPTLPYIFREFIKSFSSGYNSNFNSTRNTNVSDSIVKIPWDNVSSSSSYNFSSSLDFVKIIDKIISFTKKEAKEGFKFLKNINPFNLSYTKSFQSSYYSLRKLPDYYYRFGFTHKIPFDSTSPYSLSNNIVENETKSVSTGFDFELLSIDLKYETGDRITRPFNSPPSKTHRIQFPSIDLTVSAIHMKFEGLKKYLSSLNFQSGYTKEIEKTRSFTSLNINESNNFSPLLSFQGRLRNGVGFNLSYNLNKRTGRSITQTASYSSNSETRTFSGSFEFSYSNPKGIRLPFSKTSILKLKSQLNVNLRFSLSETKSAAGNRIDHRSSTNFNIDLNYALTKDITGAGSIEYIKYLDKRTGIGSGHFKILVGASFRF
ncbi:MAG: hypothetical protein ABIM49_02200 [candidate division WOR-3 bacterium]